MRWIWIDRFVEFESGSHATTIKNVTMAEDHIHDHFPGFPIMPPSLILEGLAQTGGILLSEATEFRQLVVLAKIPKVAFHGTAGPGDTLTYVVKLLDAREDGGIVEATARVGDRLIAECEIVFARLERQAPDSLDRKDFVYSMHLLTGLKGNSAEKPPQARSANPSGVG
jgi:3-hydroxyacyl-[acyl-carrier-protein] dehydratase